MASSSASPNNSSSATFSVSDYSAPFKESIAEQMSILCEITKQEAYHIVEEYKNHEIGDFVFNIPKLNQFRKLSGDPKSFAKQWSEKFKTNDIVVEAVQPSQAPMIVFKVNRLMLMKAITGEVLQQKELYGCSKQGEGRNVIIEFSSPNIAKPFHAGHLRSTIIGNFLKNLFKSMGYSVIAINYLGDWGKQYGLLAVGFSKFGSQELLEKDPIRHLFDIYVKINKLKEEHPEIDDEARAYFKRMENGDEEALKLWQYFRSLSIEEYKKIYKRLNVEFDEYSGESLQSDRMIVELKKIESLGLLEDNGGAKVIKLGEKLGSALVTKKDGTTLYLTRDIAAAVSRQERYHFDKMYYVVAMQQNLHFQQLFAILSKMNYEWVKNCTHVSFGLVKGMSTRKGEVVFLQDILDEAKQTMLEEMKKNEAKFKEIKDPEYVADLIGLSAVVVQDLSARCIKDYAFQWSRMTSFEGDTGPYLQYTHTRLCSIERKAAEQGIHVNPDADVSLLVSESSAYELAILIGRYPSVLQMAVQQLEPCVLVSYLFNLCHQMSLVLEKLRVLGVEKNLAEARLLIFWAAKISLASGLKILGLIPLERM